ncbi:MAG: hypothetical protein CMJ47_10455 [Planctomyces sp.]|nr:hypothetical protein [Planctomyces sp.]
MLRILPCFLCLVAAPALAAPPSLSSVETVLGPKLYRDGDVIEITNVQATSPKLEQGDTAVVKGRVRLQSQPEAQLCLYLTQTKSNGRSETDASQRTNISRGLQDFELKMTIKHQGALHLTLYHPKTGRPFGGVYFGTPDQMKDIEHWSLDYYLKD